MSESNLDEEDDVLVTQAEQGAWGASKAQVFRDVPGESEFVNQRNEAWRVNPRFGFEDYAPVTLDSELQAVPGRHGPTHNLGAAWSSPLPTNYPTVDLNLPQCQPRLQEKRAISKVDA